ncbi:uncharacterized protein LOC143030497 [Oratosquilla oratoria]|uniref:uncharacterized protein LOC143030497 n=1 Tax=Oratosquilla oratoria TaxID=337810 RepID=UPI003F760AF9
MGTFESVGLRHLRGVVGNVLGTRKILVRFPFSAKYLIMAFQRLFTMADTKFTCNFTEPDKASVSYRGCIVHQGIGLRSEQKRQVSFHGEYILYRKIATCQLKHENNCYRLPSLHMLGREPALQSPFRQSGTQDITPGTDAPKGPVSFRGSKKPTMCHLHAWNLQAIVITMVSSVDVVTTSGNSLYKDGLATP